MKRKDLIRILRDHLSTIMIDRFPDGISNHEMESLLGLVFNVILEVVSSGDEVRVNPFGVFHPKIIQSKGEIVNIKLAFTPFLVANKSIKDRFPSSLIEGSRAQVFSVKGPVAVVDSEGNPLYSLGAIADMAGISLPTAYKYVKKYEPDFTTVGGAKRYTEEIAIRFRAIKEANTSKEAVAKKEGQKLYNLTEIHKITKISIPTLYKYIRKYKEQIDSMAVVSGCNKFYTEEALKFFINTKRQNMERWS